MITGGKRKPEALQCDCIYKPQVFVCLYNYECFGATCVAKINLFHLKSGEKSK